jgi:hypothetical protein
MGSLVVVVPVGGPMTVGPVITRQPFGEQVVFAGQHPPPSSAKHSKYEGRHFGKAVQDASHSNFVSVELQQYMLDGVREVG